MCVGRILPLKGQTKPPPPHCRLLGNSSHRANGPAGSEGFTRAHPTVSSRPSDFGLARPTQTHKHHPGPPTPPPTAPCSLLSHFPSLNHKPRVMVEVIASPQNWNFWGQSHHHLLSTSWGGGGGSQTSVSATQPLPCQSLWTRTKKTPGLGCQQGLGDWAGGPPP